MLRQVMDVLEILDSPYANGKEVAELFIPYEGVIVEIEKVGSEKGSTDIVRILIEGEDPSLPVLGVIGQLGGIGARPEMIGFVSDGDGAAAALALALKAAQASDKGDRLPGNLYVATHICPDAPTQRHEPVPFMGSPIGTRQALQAMLKRRLDAVISIDTTKGNRLINWKGIAITPTVKEGYILKVSDDLLDICESVTGQPARVLPITMQDITPYGNRVHHINSIMQPCTLLSVPVVGLAITTELAVPGCATGSSHELDIELAARFSLEVAKRFGQNKCKLFDHTEFERISGLYGDMSRLVFSTEDLEND
ncbi:Protein of unknown function (DUF1177) [Mesotoga prima MesG1.Ag.4.2]|uniref:DUF1177 domain-containing protein n=1 Tax=Mesotoga prima MesG1.Ag.4.2 TaxID=660470 RepID=I2F4D5_9BACT|nr:DUF1177 domain-containing protein [Mesotoga prima]AFK06788.1 Protein of unknown function (DUF1177) [Mesotoga prima MesG1.Ag.4.2]